MKIETLHVKVNKGESVCGEEIIILSAKRHPNISYWQLE